MRADKACDDLPYKIERFGCAPLKMLETIILLPDLPSRIFENAG
jgi:hypothetical protein